MAKTKLEDLNTGQRFKFKKYGSVFKVEEKNRDFTKVTNLKAPNASEEITDKSREVILFQ